MNPLYAILSGFEVGNTPGVGTFYDFFNRLWDSDEDHMSPHIHPLKTKVKKPKTNGTKADPVEKVTLLIFFRLWGKQILNLMNSLMLLSFRFIRKNFSMFPFPKDLSMPIPWH